MKRNLIIASILIGGIFGLLPEIIKIAIFTGLAVYLFFKYDEWSYNYEHKVGGAE
ncbi:hypothetical protein [Enterococcus gilvus]|uniref:Uncharacterized protein n=1 Tax=Enterococcus gilvus ATCC BAA-350 TaxID=1158614 RepID=R2XMX2_9ENTE|nr:hypothetical protein [Enterococcus gilvus]EOI56259.1 hypothetical protein UKC_02157 [Enterococcus gilvus ATCC BAA-350]EOW82491.1 hypothetical protein I592_01810 [Enterococcus gilvus ATCC BAA-350]OJG44427.1 hypothetical protein RV02_GL000033 [Enterococcus gilvus]